MTDIKEFLDKVPFCSGCNEPLVYDSIVGEWACVNCGYTDEYYFKNG